VPTHLANANGPSSSVCIGAQIENVSRSGPPGQHVQRRDASYPTLAILMLAMASILETLAMRPIRNYMEKLK
jgi:hypothetical protein